jgi:hypothetical protein
MRDVLRIPGMDERVALGDTVNEETFRRSAPAGEYRDRGNRGGERHGSKGQ